MAARDNVLFHASISSGATAGTVIPLSCIYGVENVRQGYGTPVLKSVRGVYNGCYSAAPGIEVSIKNSNWIDAAGLIAQKIDNETALDNHSLAYMRGRDKVLAPNTSWIVDCTLLGNTTAAGDIYVLFEIEYSDVPGISTEKRAGSPVMKRCSAASVTGAANTMVSLGTFDNLLQGTTYVLSEVSLNISNNATNCNFVVVEGFSNQRGLIRILPARNSGTSEQIEGSVYLLKQTYNVGVIRSAALSSTGVIVTMEMIADKN